MVNNQIWLTIRATNNRLLLASPALMGRPEQARLLILREDEDEQARLLILPEDEDEQAGMRVLPIDEEILRCAQEGCVFYLNKQGCLFYEKMKMNKQGCLFY